MSVLGTLPGVEAVGQLAMLKTRVKFGTALKEVEKAFDAAAKRENLPRDEIEELGVPSYGMEEVGRRIETFGDYTAEMAADGDGFSIEWAKADGSPLKSIPASVKKDHAEEWKELQASAKDAGMMLDLPARRPRLHLPRPQDLAAGDLAGTLPRPPARWRRRPPPDLELRRREDAPRRPLS